MHAKSITIYCPYTAIKKIVCYVPRISFKSLKNIGWYLEVLVKYFLDQIKSKYIFTPIN